MVVAFQFISIIGDGDGGSRIEIEELCPQYWSGGGEEHFFHCDDFLVLP